MNRVFVDTSAWFALANKGDQNNACAVNWLRSNSLPLFTTNHVFSETITLINNRLGHKQAVVFGKMLRESKSLLLYKTATEEEEDAWAIFQKYPDKNFSFVDCICFAVMRKQRIRDAFAFDKHFKQAGFNILPIELTRRPL